MHNDTPSCCITCKHSVTLFRKDREERHTTTYAPTGFVRCSGPRYRGRSFFIRERKTCPEYERKEQKPCDTD